MKFTLEVESGNQAMVDNPIDELHDIFGQVTTKMLNGRTEGQVLDTNGNTVGSFTLEVDGE